MDESITATRHLRHIFGAAGLILPLFAAPAGAQVNVLTQHNDNFRDGVNAGETILTPENVNASPWPAHLQRRLASSSYLTKRSVASTCTSAIKSCPDCVRGSSM